jgi:SAM-dependent methyltransferase
MNTQVDFFDRSYAHFAEEVLAEIREAAFGEDIGQHGWSTADEYVEFIRFLGLKPGVHVLEVASGSGGPAVYLASRTGCSVSGIDVNALGVAAAKRAAARAGLESRLEFCECDATHRLPFADHTFDALLCIDSMNHFPNRLACLCEWLRVLKPGGRAVFTDPVVVAGPVTHAEFALRSSIGVFVFVPRGFNEELITKAGFKLVSQLDSTENAAVVSRRWKEARESFREQLERMEGSKQRREIQDFLGAVHKLTSERRLLRETYFVEKPAAGS